MKSRQWRLSRKLLMKLWFMVSGKVRVLNENNLLLPSETLRHRTTPPSVRLSNSCRTEVKMSIVWLCYLKVWSGGRERRGINCQVTGCWPSLEITRIVCKLYRVVFVFRMFEVEGEGGQIYTDFLVKKFVFVGLFWFFFFFCFFFFFLFFFLLFRGLKLRGRETIVKDEEHWGLPVSHNAFVVR